MKWQQLQFSLAMTCMLAAPLSARRQQALNPKVLFGLIEKDLVTFPPSDMTEVDYALWAV